MKGSGGLRGAEDPEREQGTQESGGRRVGAVEYGDGRRDRTKNSAASLAVEGGAEGRSEAVKLHSQAVADCAR
jgi:hypothetical protein